MKICFIGIHRIFGEKNGWGRLQEYVMCLDCKKECNRGIFNQCSRLSVRLSEIRREIAQLLR